jgi:hypothetical protein
MHNSAALLLPLLNDGIKLLVYAGNADGMCNYMVSLIPSIPNILQEPCALTFRLGQLQLDARP